MCGYGSTVIDNNLASLVCSELGFSSYGIARVLEVFSALCRC